MYKLKTPSRPKLFEDQELKKSLRLDEKEQNQNAWNQQLQQQKDQNIADRQDKKQQQSIQQAIEKLLYEKVKNKENDNSGELVYRKKVQHKSSLYLYLKCQNAAWGACVVGYTVSELGLSFDHLAVRYNLDQSEKRNIVAFGVVILSFGGMLGALVSHFVMNKIKRCNYMIIADLICIIGTGLFQITHWWALIAARFIMGIGLGINTCVIPLYIREISPDNMAARTGAFFQANIDLGIVFGFILNLPLESVNDNTTYVGNIWRLVFLFPIIFSLIRIATMLFIYQIDTPYFYFLQHRNKEGLIAIQQIYKDEYVPVMEQSLSTMPQGSLNDLSVRNQPALQPEEQKKSYLKRLAVGVGVNFFQQMTGNTYLSVYSVAILSVFETDYSNLIFLVLASYIFLFFVSTIGIKLNSKLKKKYLMMGLMFCSVSQFTLAGLISHEEFAQDNDIMRFLFVLFLFLFYVSYHFSIGRVTSIFTADILKDNGLSYCGVANWLASAFSLILFFNDIYYINHIIFGVFSFLGIFFAYRYIIETKVMTFNQIERKYLDN